MVSETKLVGLQFQTRRAPPDPTVWDCTEILVSCHGLGRLTTQELLVFLYMRQVDHTRNKSNPQDPLLCVPAWLPLACALTAAVLPHLVSKSWITDLICRLIIVLSTTYTRHDLPIARDRCPQVLPEFSGVGISWSGTRPDWWFWRCVTFVCVL